MELAILISLPIVLAVLLLDGHYREKRMMAIVTSAFLNAETNRKVEHQATVEAQQYIHESLRDAISTAHDEFKAESDKLREHSELIVNHKKALDDAAHVEQINPRRVVHRG